MKKQVLFILAMGVSFTPVIFAEGNLSDLAEGLPHHTGELTFEETMKSPSAVRCNGENSSKSTPVGSGPVPSSGKSSRTAGVAR